MTDPLLDHVTGLETRATLHAFLDARDVSTPLAVVLCDVVGLKATNDRDGFSAGDGVLRRAAARARGRLARGRRSPPAIPRRVPVPTSLANGWWRTAGGERLVANGSIPRIVYGRLLMPSTCRSAHGRRDHRVSRANPTPTACRRMSPPHAENGVNLGVWRAISTRKRGELLPNAFGK